MRNAVGTVVSVIAIVAALLTTADPAAAQATSREPVVRITARSIGNDGSRTGSIASSGPHKASERAAAHLYAGDTQRGTALCTIGAADSAPKDLGDLVRNRLHVWTFTTMPAKPITGGIAVDLEWARYSDGNSARPAQSGRQQLQLVEGRPVVLDLVRGGEQGPCQVDSVIIEVEADILEGSASADRLLQYDLWLVHTDPTGRKTSQHLVATGLHGMELPFAFSPMRTPVPQVTPGQRDLNVATRVTGTLRGRITIEGGIELEVAVDRRHQIERTGAAEANDTLGGIGRGRKVLSIAAGETIAIELPASTGFAITGSNVSGRAQAASASQGGGQVAVQPVTTNNGSIRVNFGPFFEGHDMSVLIRARLAN